MTSAHQRWPWWWRLGVPALIGLVVVTLGAIWWYTSEADLRRFEADAGAANVTLEWPGLLGTTTVAEADRKKWDEFERRLSTLSPWYDPTASPPRRLPGWGEAASAAMIAHVRAHEAVIAAAIDALPAYRPVLDAAPRLSSPMRWLTPLIKAGRVQSEVLLISDPGEAAEACDRLLRILEYTPNQPSTLVLLVEISVGARILSAVAQRRDALTAEEQNTLSVRFDAIAERFAAGFEWGIHGEMILFHHTIRQPEAVALVTSTTDINPVLAALALRTGRRHVLETYLETVVSLRHPSETSFTVHAKLQDLILPIERASGWNPQYYLARSVLPVMGTVHGKAQQAHSQWTLAARLLRGEGPGIDPVTSEPYREFLRNGVSVGWYSPGFDGDQGGDQRKDWCLAWDLPWVAPILPMEADAGGLPGFPPSGPPPSGPPSGLP